MFGQINHWFEQVLTNIETYLDPKPTQIGGVQEEGLWEENKEIIIIFIVAFVLILLIIAFFVMRERSSDDDDFYGPDVGDIERIKALRDLRMARKAQAVRAISAARGGIEEVSNRLARGKATGFPGFSSLTPEEQDAVLAGFDTLPNTGRTRSARAGPAYVPRGKRYIRRR